MAEQWPSSTPVEFEPACESLITNVTSEDRDSSVISTLILDIKEFVDARESCKFRKIWKEHNRITHNLAQFALKSSSSCISFSSILLCIQDLVLSDRYRYRCRSGWGRFFLQKKK
jgi:hypothetical protein